MMSTHLFYSPSRLAKVAGLLIFGMLSCTTASAACVNSVSLLKATLTTGTFVSQPLTIQLVQGIYLIDDDLIYALAGPITIEGGYTANCLARTVNPANTVIDIGQAHQLALTQPKGSPQAQINMDGLTLANTNMSTLLFSGHYNPIQANDEGSIRLTNMRITQVVTVSTPLTVSAQSGDIHMENVQIDHVGTQDDCAVILRANGGTSVFINHMTAELTTGSDFCFEDGVGTGSDPAHFSVSNSILWSDSAAQAIFRGGNKQDSTYNFVNDLFADRQIIGSVSVQNQINAAPLWVNPTAGNYRLQNASPAVNSGTAIVPGGEPATDIEGQTRIIGAVPDRGAYESNVSNQSDLAVTNTLDSGPGSLRQAMAEANSSPAIAKSIKFNIRTPDQTPVCPAVITLATTLPAIDAPISIDGYSQPGSLVNTNANSFNAKLCVLVKPASGTLPIGFKVLSTAGDTASLKLRGIGLGGFGQPLVLLGGQSHVIAGNQFGGIANGIILPGAGLNAISAGVNATGSLIIGGINLADRNVIGGAGSAGIIVQSTILSAPNNCQVVNNLIGLAPNGILALASNVGVNIGGSGCSIVGNRIAGNTYANVWLIGDQNVVQQNQVGLNIQNDGFFSNTYGILVTGIGNTIGAGGNGGAITANTVRYNIAGGVVITGDSAISNAVNANRIFDNGGNSNGMDIDLIATGGVAGPTANDSSDLDSGPNDLQNFPIIKGLVYTGAGGLNRPATVTAQLSTVPGTYRVDVYFSNAVNPLGKRGHAEIILTHTTVQVPASGSVNFSVPISIPNPSVDGVLSMTATNSGGGTSELSVGTSTDIIFADGLE